MAEVLGLAPARLRPVGLRAVAAAAICVLLGLAATQPIVRTTRTEHVRRSSQVLFVVDVSRSMLASDGPAGRSRLERAKSIVLGLDPVGIVLLVMSMMVSIVTFMLPRTNVLLGAVHLLMFLGYLVLLFER